MGERAYHRTRLDAAERVQLNRTPSSYKIFECFDIGGAVLAFDDAINHLDAARRTDPAGRACRRIRARSAPGETTSCRKRQRKKLFIVI